MDLVQGTTLRAWMETAHPWRKVLDIFVQAGRGLAAAHEAGLVHRDFKPDNVLVEDGHARVVDFGLARPQSIGEDSVDPTAEVEVDQLTHSDAIVGTPAYMAPEAFHGEVGERSDQFAFCASLYEALYGVRPFHGDTFAELAAAIVDHRLTPARPGRPRVPGWLRQIVLRGLARDPDARWDSMGALLHEVERRRRRSWTSMLVAVGGGGVVVGALAVFASAPASRPGCDEAAERIDAVWNPERRASIARAFEATGLPHAHDAWSGAEAALDAWATEWAAARVDACRATYERGDQSEAMFDARLGCLGHRLDELEALVHAFESPDEPVVTDAVAASRSLGPLEDCADLEALRRRLVARGGAPRAEPPPELYARLARAETGDRTGKYAEALVDARRLAEEADAGGYGELASSAHRVVAVLEDCQGELEAAEASAKRAIARAEVLGDDELRARAQTLLVSVLARRHQLGPAEDWAALTRATLERLGDPPRLQASLLASEGVIAYSAGRYEDSLARRREALAVREELLDEGDPRLADAHRGIARALIELGRAEEAREEMETALAIRVAAVGPHHPAVARDHMSLAEIPSALGLFEEAIEHLRVAIDVGSLALGPRDAFVGAAYCDLGAAVAQGRDPAGLVEHFRECIAILEEARGPDDIDVGYALSNLGRVLAHIDRAEEAIAVLERALVIHEKVLGPEHADEMYVLNNLALAYQEVGRSGAALDAARRALAIGEKAFGAEHPLVGQAWLHVGEIERAQGHDTEAIDALRRAVAIAEAVDSRPAEAGVAGFELAQAYAAAGQHEAALAQAHRARAAFERDPVDHAGRVRAIDAWLAAQ